MANYLGYTYIDSAEVICFDENGNFLADKTDEVLSERLKIWITQSFLDSTAQNRTEA